MVTASTMQPTALNDAQLVARCLAGDRQAFGQIVERHQTLVCSLAYSATGSLTQSEDLAQQTFVAAWRQLRRLREPAKLRAWLCGIARNLVHDAMRRSRREPAHAAEPIDAVAESPAPEPLPVDQVISREEEGILWRSLERIPELYREPLILFYREHQSIKQVATALDLSEDAVKQRLSRGRGMLQEQVAAFVEGALRRSGPGAAFTLGVLAALPAFTASATAATVGATAVKGSAVARAALTTGLAGAFLGPLLGLLGGYLGAKASIENTKSPRERRFMVRFAWISAGLVLLFTAALRGLIFLAGSLLRSHPAVYALLFVGVLMSYALGLVGIILWANRRQRRIQHEEAMKDPKPQTQTTAAIAQPQLLEYRSRVALLGLPLVHARFGCAPGGKPGWVKGWIAIGDRTFGVILSLGGLAVGGIAIGGLAAGVVSVGGLALGLAACGGVAFGGLALGGLAVGGLAVGGGAIGYLALGGGAIGWKAAEGGLAIAREFAQGGMAVAQHADDEAARAYFQNSAFFSRGTALMKSLSSPWALPVILIVSFVPGVVMACWQRCMRRKPPPGVERR
jgi:RNA polymerase sigma factor (sigma-70 family)